MRIRKIYKQKQEHVNQITVTGKIVQNLDNVDFGEHLYAKNPFGGKTVCPLVIESSTTQIIETDDGYEDTRKNIFNVNLYEELAESVVDNDDFYIGKRVEVSGYFISKNYNKIEEKPDIMNACNRYKNLKETSRPSIGEGKHPFQDKETGDFYTKYLIDWDALLSEGLITSIPDEEAQELGKVEYFFIEDGRVFRLEQKTNYILIAKSIKPIEDFIDFNKGDINEAEIAGFAKDIYVNNYDGYNTGHLCLICNSSDMTRNSYIHAVCKAKDLSILNNINIDDIVKVKGRIKHKILTKTIVKKKGKKEFLYTQYTNLYEIDCKELLIFKN